MEIFNELNERVLEDKMQVLVLDNLITSGKEGSAIPNYKNIEFINHNVIEKFKCDKKIDYIVPRSRDCFTLLLSCLSS